MTPRTQAIRSWINASTQADATQAIIDLAMAPEEFVPGCDGPDACPDEWQPAGHVAPAP